MDDKTAKSSSRMNVKKTDKVVKFCSQCSLEKRCKACDKTFDRKYTLHTTTFHQLRTDLTNFVSGTSKNMIVDIGCPNTVISRKDVDYFVQNLSKSQQENLKVVQVDEKFKFGPSGPFQCSQKLQFPINDGFKKLYVHVSIVEVNIPMLLGNNILKPLQAEIILFSSVLRLKHLEIEMKETQGGHYTVKVKDLGKACEMLGDSSVLCATTSLEKCECEECGESFTSKGALKQHTETTHENELDVMKNKLKKSILKNMKQETIEVQVSLDHVLTDLNTLFNGSKSKSEKKLITTLMNLTKHQDKHEKSKPELQKNKEEIQPGLTKQILLAHHDLIESNLDDEDKDCEIELNEVIWDVFLSNVDDSKELSEKEEKEILKLHRYFAHRNSRKLWENLFQPAGRFRGKKRLIQEFLDKCDVCRKHKKTPPRPKVGLPKSHDVNEVVSIDLKIMKKGGKGEVAILYLHDEFSKLIKGQVLNDKNKDTIIKGIDNKWIIGGGAGPGHPSRGFFSDNGGEFLNEDFIDFAAALNITVKMTAASSPWMNGSCERAHATVDKMVEKILLDEPKIGLQKAVDLACFVKNTEINKTGFSPLQLFCGKSPSFPGLSDCSPSSIELEGNNEYIKILRRMDEVRVSARQIDCNQRMKLALKSKVNPSCEKSYNYGDRVHFKLDSSNKWKTGTVLGQDGKVLFVKYGNFLRRVTLDRVIPAGGYNNDAPEEVDKNDEVNKDRLLDDDFENVDIVVEKDKEIEQLKKQNAENEKHISELVKKAVDNAKLQQKATHKKPPIALPKLHHKIKFRLAGKNDFLFGKVMNKNKIKSVHKK